MKKVLIVLLVLGAAGCSSVPSGSKYSAPDFVRAAEKECKAKGYLYARGAYKIEKGNLALAKTMAVQTARAELSRQLSSMTKGLVESIVTDDGNASSEISQTVSMADLSGSVVEEEDAFGDNYWVVISFDRTRADKIISQAASSKLSPGKVKELENKLDDAIDKTFR